MTTAPITKLYFGGIPTGPDMRRLDDRFNAISPGDIIALADIGQVIQQEVRSNRFRTVLEAWRRLLLKRNNLISKREGERLRFLRTEERAADAAIGIGIGARKIRRSVVRVELIPVEQLDETKRNTVTHLRRAASAIASAMSTSMREIAIIMKPPEQLPRIRIGKTV